MADIVPPDERECERCGRKDRWDEAAQKWVVVEEDGKLQHGKAHCLHEWDINGAYNPLKE